MAILLHGSLASWGADAAPNVAAPADRYLLQEQKQQQIRVSTSRVRDQLDSIIGEFDRNSIGGEEVKVLRGIREVLGRLSEEEMQQVIEYLQQSRAAPDSNAATRQATEAYAKQQGILVQLRQLELEYRRQQELNELALRLKELAQRQSDNMWLGVNLVKSVEGRLFNTYDESQRISLRFQQSQQTPLKEEAAGILRKIENLAERLVDADNAARPKAALAQAKTGGLMTALNSANMDLSESGLKLLSAVGHEKRARDQLREIARLLIQSPDAAEMLREAMHELDHVIDQQRKVGVETHRAETKKDADSRATDQAEVVDNAESIRKDLESLAPVASEQLKAAEDKMQDARASLGREEAVRRRVDQAVPKQAEALTGLLEARESLAEQLAKIEERMETPQNKLAQLRSMLEQVRDILQKQDALKKDTAIADPATLRTNAPHQGSLKDRTQELQSQAASAVPSAAPALGEAADEMQKSQVALSKAQNDPVAQQSALEALQRAEQQIAQELAELEKAEQELAALEELLKKLAAVIEQEQDVRMETARAATKENPVPTPALNAQQDQALKTTDQLSQEAGESSPPAAKHLAKAKDQMSDAKAELAKPSPKTAAPKEADALNELYAAKRDLEAKRDELKDKLGEPEDESSSLADAQQAIEEARKEVAEAQAEMDSAQSTPSDAAQGAMKKASKSLQKAQRKVSPLASGAQGEMPKGAQKSLQEAVESLTDGSAQAEAEQSPEAKQSASSAAQSLAQAAAALALAQAGMNSDMAMAQPGQGQGQGQGKGQAKGQGQGKGKGQGRSQGQPGQGSPNPQGDGNRGNWAGAGGADGAHSGANGGSTFLRLPGRDRAAILQSQAEKYPQEYGPLVEQYLKNLADQSSTDGK